MPLILLKLIRNPWAIGALSVILVGGIQQARVWKSHAEMSACKSGLSAQREAWAASSLAGEKAARAAVEAAVARERESEAVRRAQEQETAERLRALAEDAARAAGEWRRRYREAAENNPSCAAWSAEIIKCPVD